MQKVLERWREARAYFLLYTPPTVTSYWRIAKRPRDHHSSSNPHPASVSANQNSRSHSPSHQKPQKRQYTMNSRDAAYDEMMALIVENNMQRWSGPHQRNCHQVLSMEASTDRQMAMSNSPALRPLRKSGNVPQKTRQSVFLRFLIFVTHRIPTVARQSNAHDLRRQPLINPLCQSPLMRTLQCRHPSPSQCLHPQFHLQRAARHIIDVCVYEQCAT